MQQEWSRTRKLVFSIMNPQTTWQDERQVGEEIQVAQRLLQWTKSFSSSAGIAVSFNSATSAPKPSPFPLLKEAGAEFKASYQFSMSYKKLTSLSLPSFLGPGADSHLPAGDLHTAMFSSAQKHWVSAQKRSFPQGPAVGPLRRLFPFSSI